MALEPIGVANGHGRIKQKVSLAPPLSSPDTELTCVLQTVFNILDQDGFGRFTECALFRAALGTADSSLFLLRSPHHAGRVHVASQERARSGQGVQLSRRQRSHDGQGQFAVADCFEPGLTVCAQDLTLKGVANTTDVAITDLDRKSVV